MNERSFMFLDGAVLADQSPVPRGEQTRKAILDAAEKLFLDSGYNGTSMRQIANEIGMAVGGIYNHYASKDAIFKALLEERSMYPQIVEVVNSIQGVDGPDMLRKALIEVRQIVLDNKQFIGLVMIDVREFDGSTIRGLMSTVLPQFLRFAQRVIAAGGIRKDVNLFVLMRTFAMTMLGYILTDMVVFPRGHAMVASMPDLGDEVWQNAIMDVYLNGIAARDEEGEEQS
jgi:AcrR family transcriptional regulator